MTTSSPESSEEIGREAGLSRRSLLKASAAFIPLGAAATMAGCSPPGAGTAPATDPDESRAVPASSGAGRHIAVVGAGAFGGWTALHLLRSGARVTLVDTWGPGHTRASSGGETRVIRYTYGPTRLYVDWVIRARQQWLENGVRWNNQLYHETGVLWLVRDDEEYETASLPHLDAAQVEYERLEPGALASRFPQINPDGVRWAIYERQAGFLLARRGCEAVVRGFLDEGGEYRQARAIPTTGDSGELAGLALSDGGRLSADAYVFACGPWLGEIFPRLMGDLIKATRQEVYYFGNPSGSTDYDAGNCPVWADPAGRFWYGIPGGERRGFKLADDQHGRTVDPTTQDRRVSLEGIQRARDFMEYRFPGMTGAPFLEGRVCQYENSPDGHFIIDRHPGAENLWIVGGGSGHGYKHGPALGEFVAGLVLGDGQTHPMFSLSRFG